MTEWQDFISTQGGELAEAEFICSLEELGLILVNGDDATDFLQNQLSNDISLIDENSFQISSYSTPKGRMLGIFRVVRISNGYLLLTPRSMVPTLLERLHHFILQARVGLADASDYFARFAIQSANAEHPLLAPGPGTTRQNDSVVSLQLEPLGEQRRYLLLCLSATEAIDLWRQFADQLVVSDYRAWHLTEILSGIPAIYPQTAEEFVVQMANLNPLNGVSFKKGCYPGQEIVARMQYLGKLKRRMYLAQLQTERLPAPGDALVTAGKDSADGSGMVVDSEFDRDGICHCLYIARIAKADAGQLQLLSQPDIRIENVDLPYPLDLN